MKERMCDQARDVTVPKTKPSDSVGVDWSLAQAVIDRRSAFGRGIFAGLAAVVAQACSNSDLIASGDTQSMRRVSDSTPDPTEFAPTLGGSGTSVTPFQGSSVDNGTDSNQEIDESNGTLGADSGDEEEASNDSDGTDSVDKEGMDAGGGNGMNGGSDGMDGGGGTNSDGGGTIGSGEDTCRATDINKIDPSKIPDAPAELIPQVVFYGRDKSAMVAMQFSKGDGIAQVVVCKENGQLLALHGMTGADAGGTRPIIIDNVILSGVNNIRIVLQMTDAKRYVTMIAKVYFRQFKNAAITDVLDAPNPNQQSVAQFRETVGTFNRDPNIVYPNDYNTNSVRNLQTAKQDTSWTAESGVKGIVTNIMGQELMSISGSAIIEYPTFCTYSGNFRTMIRIG